MRPLWAIMRHMERTQIIALIEALAAGTLRSPHTIGRWVSGSGDFYLRLKNGGDITTRRAQVIASRLHMVWPETLPWPADIPAPDAHSDADTSAT